MKDLIIEALNIAYNDCLESIGKTETVTKEEVINNYSDLREINEIVKKKGIPENCWIQSCDDFGGFGLKICWEVTKRISKATKEKLLKEKLPGKFIAALHHVGIKTGRIKRVYRTHRNPPKSLFPGIDGDSPLYSMYVSKEFDKIVADCTMIYEEN